MAPLAPLSTKSTVSKVKNEFDDMFDDLLDAPVPTKMKKSKSKSRKSSKSSSKKSSKNYDDYDYGDVPLSPELGQSMDSFKYDAPGNKFTAPSNINEADLDDSILGGKLTTACYFRDNPPRPRHCPPQLRQFSHLVYVYRTFWRGQ